MFCNYLVVGINGGQMPVLWPTGCANMPTDTIHQCLTPHTHLKILSDVLVSHNEITSVGDMFLDVGDGLGVYSLFAWGLLMIHKVRSLKKEI